MKAYARKRVSSWLADKVGPLEHDKLDHATENEYLPRCRW